MSSTKATSSCIPDKVLATVVAFLVRSHDSHSFNPFTTLLPEVEHPKSELSRRWLALQMPGLTISGRNS